MPPCGRVRIEHLAGRLDQARALLGGQLRQRAPIAHDFLEHLDRRAKALLQVKDLGFVKRGGTASHEH